MSARRVGIGRKDTVQQLTCSCEIVTVLQNIRLQEEQAGSRMGPCNPWTQRRLGTPKVAGLTRGAREIEIVCGHSPGVLCATGR